MHHNQQLSDWGSFTRAAKLHFGPSKFTNHQAELFKLHQLGIVSDYQLQFEKLFNWVHELTPEAILNCFISGLIPETRTEISILQPSSLADSV